MQNAGQYVPGTANAHPPQQFAPSEPSPNGGSTTSSLRQFRKRDVDKSQLEQPSKQESHVARVAPHNHYPPVSNDLYRYPSHQFSDYSPQVKYSDIADPSQSNPISTSVVQKSKPKDYMEMCNLQQHLNNQQPYSPDNGQYMHRDPTQGYPTGFKPDTHYLPKDQHQYQQLTHHSGQSKYNPMVTQNLRKYNPGPPDNPFLNKLSKIHPSMARSIISDHHLQEPQPSYSPMDQRGMYGQQNHRYYTGSLHQSNPYAPNSNYTLTHPHHYPNYSAASCNYTRTPTIGPRYSHMDRSMSPTRRVYSDNVHMNHISYHNMPQKMPSGQHYSPQYAGTPEYAQHYQHRRIGQDCYPQSLRPTQYMQNHHQIPAQEMQELPESRISPSDSLKKFIENWAADEEPSNEINPMESNMNLRENIKVRDDAPPGTVYMINATDVQYFENNGIPIVTSDNGGIQLTSENYQYLLKNGLVDNSGMVRIIEANKEVSTDSNGSHERIVNLQIMEASKSDCMMVSKALRPSDTIGSNGMLPKTDDENRRVVIHQNTVISPGNSSVASERIPSQQPQSEAPSQNALVETTSISKELVDKNCSPINLDQLENNLGFSEPEPPETESDKNQNSSIPIPSTVDSNVADSSNEPCCNEISLSEDLSHFSDDSLNKSPESKSMPIIDLFGDSHVEDGETHNANESQSQKDVNILTNNDGNNELADSNSDNQNKKTSPFDHEISKTDGVEDFTNQDENKSICSIREETVDNKTELLKDCPMDHALSQKKSVVSNNSSVIVSPEALRKDVVSNDDTKDTKFSETADFTILNQSLKTTDKDIDDMSILEAFKSEPSDQVTVGNCLPVESSPTELILESIEIKNETKPLDENKTLVELPTNIERRKRIFSVDDIIHHIGNNIKRGSREFEVFCTTQTLTTFMEKEIEFSSLEQILNTYTLQKSLNKKKQDEIISSAEHNINEIGVADSNKPVEIVKNISETSMCEPINDNQQRIIDSKRLPGLDDSSINLMNNSLTETLTGDKVVNLTEKNLEHDNEENGKIEEDIESIEEEMSSIEENLQLSSEEEFTPIEESTQSSSDLAVIERSNTPSVLQYRNAIRVEEPSVLLQISGELMEISVNIVNGKKVITVLPLSDSTVVDYNDNYEVSAIVHDSQAVHDSGTASEEVEIAKDTIDPKSEEKISDQSGDREEDIALLENHECTSIVIEEISEVIQHEDKANEELEQSDKENVLAITAVCINKVKDYNNLEEENNVEVQEEPAKRGSVDANKLFKLEKYEVAQITESGISETKTRLHNEALITEQLIPDIPKIDNVEVISSCELPETTAIQAEAANNVDTFVGEDVTKSIDDSSIVESHKTSETPKIIGASEESLQFLKSTNMSITEDTLEAANETDDLKAGNQNSIDIFAIANDIIIQPADGGCDIPDVVESSPPKADAYDVQNINCDDNILETDKTSTQAEEKMYYTDESAHDDNDFENNVSDVDAEHLDYQLEDDVFISEEPSHEIIISGPLEDVGLIEEVGKTSDCFDIPLEQVTASDEVIETPPIISNVKLKDDADKLSLTVPNKKFINIGDNVLPKDILEQREQMTLAVKEEILNTAEHAPEAPVDKSIPTLCNTKETLLIKISKSKEIVVKPEVQILSPTSTNIDDHITTSKENVYLPRRRLHTDDDSESTSITITTKAAKKSYDCDLQIPAVTTSGDISTRVSKKLMKDQHDTVSSSKKERVVKDLPRTKKSTLKRSKRINEKNKMKNEQKEMLKLLTEKRKLRKEARQNELLPKEEDRNYTTEDKEDVETRNNVNKSSEGKITEGAKQKHSTEHDDEYVDFKELLRARKLKKLKKMQEIKRREAKDIKTKIEEAHRSAAKDVNKPAISKKAVKVNKSVVVNSNCVQENKAETQKPCCIGCIGSVKKSEKDDQERSKKRKNSSDVKIDLTKPVNVKMVLSPSVDIKNVTPETADPKPNIVTDLSTADKVVDVTARVPKANVDDDKSKIKTDLPIEIKSEKFLPAPAKRSVINKEIPTCQVPIATPIENIYISKRVTLQKRVSFCDDISSSTSHNDIGSISAIEEIASSKTKTYPAPTLKDPRKRARSYAGHIMVPSVSELIEENSGAVYKKKISLADYVSRKRKTSTEKCDNKTKSEEKECIDKKTKLENSAHEIVEFVDTVPSSFKSEGVIKSSQKAMKDVKTSFVIHSSDWEDSQSPLPPIIQSNDECLIQNFSGLIKSKSTRPVIDVNELTPLENIENPKDKKLQEYKDKVDSQLSSLNIHIPKIKSQNLENKRCKVDLVPHHGSPESSTLIKKFLSSEKITQSEMEKIKKIISYKRFIQHQKNARSPSKSPASSSSAYSQSPACSSYEPTCLAGKSPVSSGSVYSDLSDPAYESKHRVKSEVDSRKKRLHLKKVNAKRKLHLDYGDESSSETRHKKNVDYSVINRLGKDGLPKIIFKRNRQCTISDSQLVVELERIDDNLELVEEKYNVTVTQFM